MSAAPEERRTWRQEELLSRNGIEQGVNYQHEHHAAKIRISKLCTGAFSFSDHTPFLAASDARS
jgi:hypothetical protein